MPHNNKSKRNIKNLLNNYILIEKMVMSKNSNNLTKPIKHSLIHKREESMISMVVKVDNLEVKKISWICSSVVEEEQLEEVVLEEESKWLKSKLHKKPSMSPYKIFTTVELSNSNTLEQDVVKNVTVKVDNKSKNVNNVKVKVWSFKCIKWVQECINKSKNIVINVQVKVKLSLKPVNANHAMERKFYKRKKLSKYQLKKVHLTTTQLLCQVKETKSLMPWLVIWF